MESFNAIMIRFSKLWSIFQTSINVAIMTKDTNP